MKKKYKSKNCHCISCDKQLKIKNVKELLIYLDCELMLTCFKCQNM